MKSILSNSEVVSFVLRLKQILKENDLSYAALCRKANLHVTTVNKWVTKSVPPSISAVRKISNAFGISESWLLYGECAEDDNNVDRRNTPKGKIYTNPEIIELVETYKAIIIKTGFNEGNFSEGELDELFDFIKLMHEKDIPLKNLVRLVGILSKKEERI